MSSQVDADLSDLQRIVLELLQANKGIRLLALIDNSGAPILMVTGDGRISTTSDFQKRLSGSVAAAVALSNRAMRAIAMDNGVSIGMRTEGGNVGIVRSDHFIILVVTDYEVNARLLALQAERMLKEYV